MSFEKSFSIGCTVKAGKLKLYDREFFDAMLARFGDGEELSLTVETADIHRTHAQNRFFHGPVLKAFMETGLYKQEAKDMLALMFIPQEIRLPDGSVARVPGHTSALSREEFRNFLDACIQLAAEQDLMIDGLDDFKASQEVSAA